ncbi:unnamed protein product, partial [Staurois parvus]
RVIRLDHEHRVIRLDRIIRPDRAIRLDHEHRGIRLNNGRRVLRQQADGLDTGRMVLVGKNFRFFLGLVTGAL